MSTSRLTRLALLSASASLVVVGLSGCSWAVLDETRPGIPTPTASEGGSGADESVVGGDAAFQSGDCGGRDIVVTANGAQLVLTGECSSLTIRGDSATVTVQSVGTIDMDSDTSVVVVERDAESASLTGDANSLTVVGLDSLTVDGDTNTVIATRLDAVELAGDTNTVTWDEGTTTPLDRGSVNTLIAP